MVLIYFNLNYQQICCFPRCHDKIYYSRILFVRTLTDRPVSMERKQYVTIQFNLNLKRKSEKGKIRTGERVTEQNKGWYCSCRLSCHVTHRHKHIQTHTDRQTDTDTLTQMHSHRHTHTHTRCTWTQKKFEIEIKSKMKRNKKKIEDFNRKEGKKVKK